MRIILALGALAIVGLTGCVEDPYGYSGGYGPGPAYGGNNYGGGGYGAPDPSARANYGEEYLSSGFDDDPRSVSVSLGRRAGCLQPGRRMRGHDLAGAGLPADL